MAQSNTYNLRDPKTWWWTKANPLNWFGSGGHLTPETNAAQRQAATTHNKPEEEQALNLQRAQNASHSLCLNSPMARSVLRAYRTGVLGNEGIKLRSEARRRNKTRGNEKVYKLNEPLNAALEKAWTEWGKCVSICGEYSWLDTQRQIINTIIESGDCLVRFYPVAPSNEAKGIKSDIMLSLQVIEGDRIDCSYNGSISSEGEFWQDGIKMDRFGRKLAYAIETKISERLYETREYDAKDILHLYFRSEERAGAVRGWPMLTSVRHVASEVRRFVEATIDFQQSNASTVAWVSPDPSSTPPAPLTEEDVDAITEQSTRGGGVRLLPSGATVHERNTAQATQIGPFIDATEEMVGMASGLTKELVTGNMTNTNFASGKLGQLLNNEQFMEKQQFMVENVHEPTLARFMKVWLLVAKGRDISLNLEDYKHSWITRTYPTSEELKAANAAKVNLELGLTSRTRLANERGIVWEDEVIQMGREQQILKENNVVLGPVATETIAVEQDRNPESLNEDGSVPGTQGTTSL